MFWFLKNKPNGYKAPKSFTISRATWARGGKNGESRLLNRIGCRCCIGFYGQACGIPDQIMLDQPGPAYLLKDHKIEMPKLVPKTAESNMLVSKMIQTNDDSSMTEGDRESAVSELFASAGVKVEFVD